MGYWRKKYGKRSNEFIRGVIAGMKEYAIWHHGVPTIGSMRRPLFEAVEEIKEDLSWREGDIG